MSRKTWTIALGAMSAVLAAGLISAQTPKHSTESAGTPDAKALLAQADTVLRGAPDFDKGLPLLVQAVKADPHFPDAYDRLSSVTRQAAIARANQNKTKTGDEVDKELDGLKKQYAEWAKADPKNAILAWAQGSLEDKDWSAGKAFYDRAVALDPYFARPYLQLSL